MTGFDIKTLVDFQPPRYLCMTCNGILFDIDYKLMKVGDERKATSKCTICGQIYIDDVYSTREFFEEHSSLKFDNLLNHSKGLAKIVEYWGGGEVSLPVAYRDVVRRTIGSKSVRSLFYMGD